GINNGVSRTAGLLAIAVFGLIMFHSFSNCLDGRLDELRVTAEIRQAMDDQRIYVAAAEIPGNADQTTVGALRQAIDECFISGFRRVMLTGAVLAIGVSAVAAAFITV